MKLPWTREREEKSVSGLMVALSQLGSARWGGRDHMALSRDGYLRNAVVNRCVRMISEAAASVPLQISDDRLQAVLRRPMPEEAGSFLFERIYHHLQISGNAYIEAVLVEGEVLPVGLQTLRPDRMKAELDPKGWITAWSYKVDRRERRILRTESGWSPILQLKLFHPNDDIYGLSPLAAARQALDLHNAGADWAKALLDNSARPSGALIYGQNGNNLTGAQFERLKTELELAHTGPDNAGRPLLLEGGLEWKPMSLSPSEMDFLEARNTAAREIALAFGVPPMLLGIRGDNTYANYREANLAFWRLTILPLVQYAAGAIAGWLSARVETEVSIEAQLDHVPAFSAERDQLWSRLEAATFLSRAEKRSLAGLPPEETS
ncbi:MAG: phage portal protein [Pseudomonadota bacterium]